MRSSGGDMEQKTQYTYTHPPLKPEVSCCHLQHDSVHVAPGWGGGDTAERWEELFLRSIVLFERHSLAISLVVANRTSKSQRFHLSFHQHLDLRPEQKQIIRRGIRRELKGVRCKVFNSDYSFPHRQEGIPPLAS